MSRQHINAYRRTLAEQHRVTGSLNEGVLRKAFADLLERTGRARELVFTNEWEGFGPRGNRIRVDGALVPPILRKPFGYWEAKDSRDDLDREIARKRDAGYPDDNIIYEDTATAVLRQDGREAMRVALSDDDALTLLLDRFYRYERPELSEFKAASAKFRADLPQVLDALRMAIGEAEARSRDYVAAAGAFLDHARQAINPGVTPEDVREMLIQHILTEEIFASVFDNAQYHRENNVARRLGELEARFFTGALRHATTELLRPYYGAIRHAASGLADRRAKQDFLKRLYEDFYKVYNPAAADRLGVVYTPGEIVRFMIRGAEWLTLRHFGKSLHDPGVELLDPATGTGTFVVELLEHMQGAGAERLRAKYENELHANEVAILPYYVANLNIEATFASITGGYAEFPGLVFVDTLDNTAGLGIFSGHQPDMFGGFADENLERVKRQNERRISVVIGNPPYNAWQQDYNSRNPNRPYKRVDDRIGQTYRRLSRAQNTNALSDMYVRFWRWASDRLRDEGVVAFVTNRNFIEKVAFDGFRLSVGHEFAEIWVMDLGGDVRANPKLSGTKHNVFGIQTGVAIAFMVRRQGEGPARLFYARRPEDETAGEKLAFLDGFELGERGFARLTPDAKGNWLSGEHADWEGFLPLADPEKGPGDVAGPVQAIFRLSSNGIESGRDEWLWGWSRKALKQKVVYFLKLYNQAVKERSEGVGLKLDRQLDKKLRGRQQIIERQSSYRVGLSRPFIKKHIYFDKDLNSYLFRLPSMYGSESNLTILQLGVASQAPFSTFATDVLFDFGVLKTGNGRTQGVTRYRYLKSGERVDNVTDWALERFRGRYPEAGVSKDDIFAYCYAALHDPVWRQTHADDLRREFPRVKLHDDFARWRDWGRALLDLHLGYERVEPWPVERVDAPPAKGRAPAPKLKSDPERGLVVVDSETQITGVPAAAWRYRLGNRSAIDWVLDQHKEKRPRDPTVAAKFDFYRFADHKEAMIDLLARVVRVSVETAAIVEEMRGAGEAT